MIGCLILPYLCTEAEMRRNPGLAGRPVAIYARGRVTGLSPEGERAGLCLGMSLGHARLLGRSNAPAQQAEFLPCDQDLYVGAQESVLAICATYLSTVEPFSLQETFFALPDAARAGPALGELERAVRSQLGFTCRAGAGISKLVARIAASEQPGTVVRAGEEAGFLAPLPVSRLWPLGEAVVQHLADLGLHTVALVQRVSVSFLTRRFGPLGKMLHELAFGMDHSPVRPLYPPAVIAAHLSLPGGVEEARAGEAALRHLAAQVAAQLRSRGQSARQLALIIEVEGGKSTSCRLRLGFPVGDEEGVRVTTQRAFKRARPKAPVTALTLQLGKLERAAGAQVDLWGERRGSREARERLGEALSCVQDRFGAQGVRWAGEMEAPRRERMLAFFTGGRW